MRPPLMRYLALGRIHPDKNRRDVCATRGLGQGSTKCVQNLLSKVPQPQRGGLAEPGQRPGSRERQMRAEPVVENFPAPKGRSSIAQANGLGQGSTKPQESRLNDGMGVSAVGSVDGRAPKPTQPGSRPGSVEVSAARGGSRWFEALR